MNAIWLLHFLLKLPNPQVPEEFKNVCGVLWGLNCFLSYNTFPTDETLLATRYSVAIYFHVRFSGELHSFVSPVQIFKARTRREKHTADSSSCPSYSTRKQNVPLTQFFPDCTIVQEHFLTIILTSAVLVTTVIYLAYTHNMHLSVPLYAPTTTTFSRSSALYWVDNCIKEKSAAFITPHLAFSE